MTFPARVVLAFVTAVACCVAAVPPAGAADTPRATGSAGATARVPASPAAEAEPFKCSPRTQRCNCTGRADCDYMKQTIGGSCGPQTCTGKGSKRKCECTLGAAK